MMITRQEAIAACLRFAEVYEDYPFGDFNWTVMRHQDNRKIFAAIFERQGCIWINVKVEPLRGDFWRSVFPCVVPTYHMNKQHWISIILDGSMDDADILTLLRDSYNLTATRRRKNPSHQL